MRAQHIVGHIRDHVRRYGAGAALRDVEYRVVNRLAHFQILKGMVIRPPDVHDSSLVDMLELDGQFVDGDELARLASAGTHDLSVDFVREASARGDRCYGLFDGGALVSYGWYADRPNPIDEHFVLHFDPAYAYMYKGYTLPAYRGRRLHAIGMCRALRAVAAEGRQGLISYVESNNFASLRSVVRMGYRPFGEVYLLRAGRRAFAYATPGCRAYGFRVESAEPRH